MDSDWEPPDFPYVEEAMSADYTVVEESGRWIVYLDVVLASGSVRRKIGEHHNFARADHAGRIFVRNATRQLRNRKPHEEGDLT